MHYRIFYRGQNMSIPASIVVYTQLCMDIHWTYGGHVFVSLVTLLEHCIRVAGDTNNKLNTKQKKNKSNY